MSQYARTAVLLMLSQYTPDACGMVVGLPVGVPASVTVKSDARESEPNTGRKRGEPVLS